MSMVLLQVRVLSWLHWTKLSLLAVVLGAVLLLELTTTISPLFYMLLLGAVWVLLVFGLKIIDIKSMLTLLTKTASPEKNS